jgi:nicotinamidase/pyrazinamidase
MLNRRNVLAGLSTLALSSLASTRLWAAAIKPHDASALLVIDVQNCFLPGGSLAVK